MTRVKEMYAVLRDAEEHLAKAIKSLEDLRYYIAQIPMDE